MFKPKSLLRFTRFVCNTYSGEKENRSNLCKKISNELQRINDSIQNKLVINQQLTKRDNGVRRVHSEELPVNALGKNANSLCTSNLRTVLQLDKNFKSKCRSSSCSKIDDNLHWIGTITNDEITTSVTNNVKGELTPVFLEKPKRNDVNVIYHVGSEKQNKKSIPNSKTSDLETVTKSKHKRRYYAPNLSRKTIKNTSKVNSAPRKLHLSHCIEGTHKFKQHSEATDVHIQLNIKSHRSGKNIKRIIQFNPLSVISTESRNGKTFSDLKIDYNFLKNRAKKDSDRKCLSYCYKTGFEEATIKKIHVNLSNESKVKNILQTDLNEIRIAPKDEKLMQSIDLFLLNKQEENNFQDELVNGLLINVSTSPSKANSQLNAEHSFNRISNYKKDYDAWSLPSHVEVPMLVHSKIKNNNELMQGHSQQSQADFQTRNYSTQRGNLIVSSKDNLKKEPFPKTKSNEHSPNAPNNKVTGYKLSSTNDVPSCNGNVYSSIYSRHNTASRDAYTNLIKNLQSRTIKTNMSCLNKSTSNCDSENSNINKNQLESTNSSASSIHEDTIKQCESTTESNTERDEKKCQCVSSNLNNQNARDNENDCAQKSVKETLRDLNIEQAFICNSLDPKYNIFSQLFSINKNYSANKTTVKDNKQSFITGGENYIKKSDDSENYELPSSPNQKVRTDVKLMHSAAYITPQVGLHEAWSRDKMYTPDKNVLKQSGAELFSVKLESKETSDKEAEKIFNVEKFKNTVAWERHKHYIKDKHILSFSGETIMKMQTENDPGKETNELRQQSNNEEMDGLMKNRNSRRKTTEVPWIENQNIDLMNVTKSMCHDIKFNEPTVTAWTRKYNASSKTNLTENTMPDATVALKEASPCKSHEPNCVCKVSTNENGQSHSHKKTGPLLKSKSSDNTEVEPYKHILHTIKNETKEGKIDQIGNNTLNRNDLKVNFSKSTPDPFYADKAFGRPMIADENVSLKSPEKSTRSSKSNTNSTSVKETVKMLNTNKNKTDGEDNKNFDQKYPYSVKQNVNNEYSVNSQKIEIAQSKSDNLTFKNKPELPATKLLTKETKLSEHNLEDESAKSDTHSKAPMVKIKSSSSNLVIETPTKKIYTSGENVAITDTTEHGYSSNFTEFMELFNKLYDKNVTEADLSYTKTPGKMEIKTKHGKFNVEIKQENGKNTYKVESKVTPETTLADSCIKQTKMEDPAKCYRDVLGNKTNSAPEINLSEIDETKKSIYKAHVPDSNTVSGNKLNENDNRISKSEMDTTDNLLKDTVTEKPKKNMETFLESKLTISNEDKPYFTVDRANITQYYKKKISLLKAHNKHYPDLNVNEKHEPNMSATTKKTAELEENKFGMARENELKPNLTKEFSNKTIDKEIVINVHANSQNNVSALLEKEKIENFETCKELKVNEILSVTNNLKIPISDNSIEHHGDEMTHTNTANVFSDNFSDETKTQFEKMAEIYEYEEKVLGIHPPNSNIFRKASNLQSDEQSHPNLQSIENMSKNRNVLTQNTKDTEDNIPVMNTIKHIADITPGFSASTTAKDSTKLAPEQIKYSTKGRITHQNYLQSSEMSQLDYKEMNNVPLQEMRKGLENLTDGKVALLRDNLKKREQFENEASHNKNPNLINNKRKGHLLQNENGTNTTVMVEDKFRNKPTERNRENKISESTPLPQQNDEMRIKMENMQYYQVPFDSSLKKNVPLKEQEVNVKDFMKMMQNESLSNNHLRQTLSVKEKMKTYMPYKMSKSMLNSLFQALFKDENTRVDQMQPEYQSSYENLKDVIQLTNELENEIPAVEKQSFSVNEKKFPLLNIKKSKFKYPKFETNFISTEYVDNMLYKHIPSVSKILNETLSSVTKKALNNWESSRFNHFDDADVYDYYQEQIMNDIQFHDCIRRRILGTPVNVLVENSTLATRGCLNSLSKVFSKLSNVALLESPVVHSQLPYHGIVDCVGCYDDCPVVIEWKQADSPKSVLQLTYDAPIQLAAYIGAINYDTQYQFPIKSGLIVVAYTDGSAADVFHLSTEDCQKYWKLWLNRLQVYMMSK